MPTSPTDPVLPGEIVLVRPGDAAALPEGTRTALVVPGTEVAIHWLELADGLAPAQAAAAARLMLADASATPLADMHVAVGKPELGLTPVALVPVGRMLDWLAEGDPQAIVPEPMLIVPPETGFLVRDHGDVADYRGPAAAFTLEPELAEAMTGALPVEPVDPVRFAATLPALLAAPPLDLRQGPFARRRSWKVDRTWLRRVVTLALAVVLLALAVQIVQILRYTFAADRTESELAALDRPGGSAARLGFGPIAARLFEAVRATPNLELARIEYRLDGSLVAAVTMDSPATFAAFRARVEASGLAVEAGTPTAAGGRPAAELTVRPS